MVNSGARMASILRPALSQGRGVANSLRRAAAPAPQRREFARKAFTVDAAEEISFPNENVAEGRSYALNWSLCGSGIVPQNVAFRNLKTPELAAAGGSISTAEPKEVKFSKPLYVSTKAKLAGRVLYVQDCALGCLTANEVPVRMISDSAATAAAFKSLCATTRGGPLKDYMEEVTVMSTAAEDSEWGTEFVSSGKADKVVVMHGQLNANTLIKHMSMIATDAFLARGVLPLWGSGGPEAVYLSEGFEGVSHIMHGFAWSEAGFCRLLMGQSDASGVVTSLYDDVPNRISPPGAVVMFADDASATIPAAAELDAAQAAFYYATSCAPDGCTNFEAAATLVMAMAQHTTFYMVNRGAFVNPADVVKVAAGLPGKKGSVSGPLDLKVVSVDAETKAMGDAPATSKALLAKAATRCKGMAVVIQAGPKAPEPAAA